MNLCCKDVMLPLPRGSLGVGVVEDVFPKVARRPVVLDDLFALLRILELHALGPLEHPVVEELR